MRYDGIYKKLCLCDLFKQQNTTNDKSENITLKYYPKTNSVEWNKITM